jgi:hypothetical protein
MPALEMLGGLDPDGLAVALRARLAVDRNFELRARRFRQRRHQRPLPSLRPSSASRFASILSKTCWQRFSNARRLWCKVC